MVRGNARLQASTSASVCMLKTDSHAIGLDKRPSGIGKIYTSTFAIQGAGRSYSMKTTRVLAGACLIGASLLVLVPAFAQEKSDKAARCKAGYQKCMAQCFGIARKNTGKPNSPARTKYCNDTFCAPEMRKYNCPGNWG